MEFNKEKFSHYVMQRPHMGEINDAQEGQHLYKFALDKAGCGDSYEMAVVADAEGKIKDAKYVTFGCGFAQATCGALIDSMLDRDLQEVLSWSDMDVERGIEGILGEYPPHKKAYLMFAKQLLDGIGEEVRAKREDLSPVS
jgi:NifU-like protein involved in Fe-S cluster formation